MAFVVDAVIVLVILGLTYALMSEGLWGSALMFFNILFSILITLNFYEPLAGLIAQNVDFLSGFADTLCMLTIFIITLAIMRGLTTFAAPSMVRFPPVLYQLGRIVFSLGGAVLTVSLILLSFHTAPVHKIMFGSVDYDKKPPFGQGLDHKLLAFFQYTTGQTFARYGHNYDDAGGGEYYDAKVFDPEGRWLIDHQNARPYGDQTVPPPEKGEAPAGQQQKSQQGG